MHINGPWNVQVDRRGDYEIRLRRWPEESHLALGANDPVLVSARRRESRCRPRAQRKHSGQSVAHCPARLKVGDQEQTIDVDPADQAAVFNLTLPAGRTRLQTWFFGPDEAELCGAYTSTCGGSSGRIDAGECHSSSTSASNRAQTKSVTDLAPGLTEVLSPRVRN